MHAIIFASYWHVLFMLFFDVLDAYAVRVNLQNDSKSY